jgi:hypothetical protein
MFQGLVEDWRDGVMKQPLAVVPDDLKRRKGEKLEGERKKERTQEGRDGLICSACRCLLLA